MTDREVHVKLSADVADYIISMNAARQATRRLGITWAGILGIAASAGSVVGAAAVLLFR